MDLATIKVENQLAPSALISQVFAPRYLTRSKVTPDTKSDHGDKSISGESNSSTLADQQSAEESTRTAESEWETSSEGTKTNYQGTVEAAAPAETKHRDLPPPSNSGRKRGRHKEYTAPTGVWKTNGGYISTVYVGNRRIYGPLRDNPEEAGVDRHKLIEAKAFATTEPEMRSFIATLKGSHDQSASSQLHLVTKREDKLVTRAEPCIEPMTKKGKPQLSFVKSSATTIEA